MFDHGFLYREGIPTCEPVLHDRDLFEADEACLTSTIREIVPIVRVDSRVMGTGPPAPTTLRLLGGFRARTRDL